MKKFAGLLRGRLAVTASTPFAMVYTDKALARWLVVADKKLVGRIQLPEAAAALPDGYIPMPQPDKLDKVVGFGQHGFEVSNPEDGDYVLEQPPSIPAVVGVLSAAFEPSPELALSIAQPDAFKTVNGAASDAMQEVIILPGGTIMYRPATQAGDGLWLTSAGTHLKPQAAAAGFYASGQYLSLLHACMKLELTALGKTAYIRLGGMDGKLAYTMTWLAKPLPKDVVAAAVAATAPVPETAPAAVEPAQPKPQRQRTPPPAVTDLQKGFEELDRRVRAHEAEGTAIRQLLSSVLKEVMKPEVRGVDATALKAENDELKKKVAAFEKLKKQLADIA